MVYICYVVNCRKDDRFHDEFGTTGSVPSYRKIDNTYEKKNNETNADPRTRRERSSPFRSTSAPALAALGPLLREGLRFFSHIFTLDHFPK